MVYILLPVHNRREVTRRFVACLKDQTYRHYRLLLIDDGSTDGTAGMVRNELEEVTVITGSGDWWWAGSLQQGYEWLRRQSVADNDLVLIANDDTEFAPDFLARAVALMRGRGGLLLASSFSRSNGRLVSGGVKIDWRRLKFASTQNPDEIDCLPTRGLFMQVADFLGLGGFYPRLLPHYLSDYEFTLRARRRGMRLWVNDGLKVLVDETTTGFREFEGENINVFLRRYFAKNSDANPFYWSAFLLLACPWPWILLSLMRVWYGTAVKVVRSIFP